MRRIPATIVTGFLGAGKTSLIRHVVANANGQRIALIINEFGDLGVDRELLLGCGDESCGEEDIVELANGCICCTVADDFLPTMQALLARSDPPEHIVIETSGLALPKPLVKAFSWPEVRSRVTVDGVIAVVDGPAVAAGMFAGDPDAVQAARLADPSVDHDDPLEELFEDQVQCADLIVLNKVDLLATEVDNIERDVRERARPGISILSATHGQLDMRVVTGIGAAAETDLDARPSHHDADDEHDHDDFETVRVRLGTITDVDALRVQLTALATAHGWLRVKGFVAVDGRPLRHVVQGVGPRIQGYFDRPWRSDELRVSELVVIGRRGLNHDAMLRDLAGG